MICPICDEGHLTPLTTTMTFDINGVSVTVSDFQHCICNNCGADPILPNQIDYNHLAIQGKLSQKHQK